MPKHRDSRARDAVAIINAAATCTTEAQLAVVCRMLTNWNRFHRSWLDLHSPFQNMDIDLRDMKQAIKHQRQQLNRNKQLSLDIGY